MDPTNGIGSFLHGCFGLHCLSQMLEIERKVHFLHWVHRDFPVGLLPLPPTLKCVQVLSGGATCTTMQHSIRQQTRQPPQLRVFKLTEGLPHANCHNIYGETSDSLLGQALQQLIHMPLIQPSSIGPPGCPSAATGSLRCQQGLAGLSH